MKNAFDTFADTGYPVVQSGLILLILVLTFGSPDLVACPSPHFCLPAFAKETFVGNDLTASQITQDRFGCQTFIGIGWNQIVNDGDATESCDRNQLTPKYFRLRLAQKP